jgi:hypothetical protein
MSFVFLRTKKYMAQDIHLTEPLEVLAHSLLINIMGVTVLIL